MNYNHLTRAERKKIFEGLSQKKSIGMIAKEIERNKSTVSRELARNSDKIGYLYPYQADELARSRKNRKRTTKIAKNLKLKNFIVQRLQERLSPKMIAALWKKKNTVIRISKESIYSFIYSDEGVEMGLVKYLVRAKKKRGFVNKMKGRKIKDAVSIHDRPQEINDRKTIGHYEGDLIFNKGSMSQNILTLTDRMTRESIMIFNESKHTQVVLGNLKGYIKKTGTKVLSITFDNGSEFAGHKELNNIGIKTYFCDPGKPYQKGSIENFNGVVRRYLPFTLHANQITPQFVQEAMIKVNNLPREILEWQTASEYAYTQRSFAS